MHGGVWGLTKNTYCHLVVTTMTPGRGGGLEGDEGGIKRREKDRTRPIVSHFLHVNVLPCLCINKCTCGSVIRLLSIQVSSCKQTREYEEFGFQLCLNVRIYLLQQFEGSMVGEQGKEKSINCLSPFLLQSGWRWC